MTASVKAVRSENGYQLDVRARVLVCRREHYKAASAYVRFIVDTGSSHTHLRLQALAGVEFKRTRWISGIGGQKVPAMQAQAHLVFNGQLLTAPVLVIDSAEASEDGLIGLDLMKGMNLRDGEASLQLATGDTWRRTSPLEEIATAKECGCWPFLRESVKDGRNISERA